MVTLLTLFVLHLVDLYQTLKEFVVGVLRQLNGQLY